MGDDSTTGKLYDIGPFAISRSIKCRGDHITLYKPGTDTDKDPNSKIFKDVAIYIDLDIPIGYKVRIQNGHISEL